MFKVLFIYEVYMSKFHLADLSLVLLYVVFQYHMDVFVVTICFLYKTIPFLVIK